MSYCCRYYHHCLPLKSLPLLRRDGCHFNPISKHIIIFITAIVMTIYRYHWRHYHHYHHCPCLCWRKYYHYCHIIVIVTAIDINVIVIIIVFILINTVNVAAIIIIIITTIIIIVIIIIVIIIVIIVAVIIMLSFFKIYSRFICSWMLHFRDSLADNWIELLTLNLNTLIFDIAVDITLLLSN